MAVSYSYLFEKYQTMEINFEQSMLLHVRDVYYRPPGTQLNLLNGVSFSLPEKSFGLISGQSGSGKTTLLQLLAGLSKPTSGSIYMERYTNEGKLIHSPESILPERVGIVFQFPERELAALVDLSWRMGMGGVLREERLNV